MKCWPKIEICIKKSRNNFTTADFRDIHLVTNINLYPFSPFTDFLNSRSFFLSSGARRRSFSKNSVQVLRISSGSRSPVQQGYKNYFSKILNYYRILNPFLYFAMAAANLSQFELPVFVGKQNNILSFSENIDAVFLEGSKCLYTIWRPKWLYGKCHIILKPRNVQICEHSICVNYIEQTYRR